MKKHILAIIMTILCLSLMLTLVACGGDNNDTNTNDTGDVPEDCVEHTWGDWTTTTYATCELDGIQKRVCTVCEEEETQRIPAGHKWSEWEVTKEVDCLNDGIEARKCSQCDKEETKTIESVGEHTWGEPVIEEATCGEDGSEYKKCTECGKEETTVLPKAEHQWTEWGIGWDDEPFVVPATCTEQGYEGRVCTGPCGEEQTRPLAIVPHKMGEWQVPEGVTCTTGGTITRACTTCDTYTEEKTVAAGDHVNVVYEGRVEPTKETDGSTGIKKCLACGDILEGAKIIKIVNVAVGSTVKTTPSPWWAAIDANAQKIVDGDRETGMYGDPKIGTMHEYITLASGSDVFEIVLVVNSKGQIAQGPKVDNVTNNNYKISFIILDENGEGVFRSQEYSTLDQTEIVVPVILPEGKTAKEIKVTHTSDYNTNNYLWEVEIFAYQTLSACEANGHSWSEWTGTEPSCSQDSLTDGVKTRNCSVCGGTETQVTKAEHAWTEWDVTNFSCTEGGTMVRSCTSCGKEESQTTEGGEHGELELVGAKEPTLEADGYTGDKVCKVCGQTTETGTVIPKLINIAIGSTVTTNTTHWHVTGQKNGNGLAALVDGNDTNGTASDPSNPTNYLTIELAEASTDIIQLVFVVNIAGSGYCPGSYASYSDTNNAYELSFVLYDEEGNAIYTSEKYQTADQKEIVVDVDLDGASVKKIEIKRFKQAYTSDLVLWEAKVITTGKSE
ncbi:MAG: hypothetical protein IJD89_00900 [Clostridia bacterium]|nr:hypothetical protein [Clostridia bacterium]